MYLTFDQVLLVSDKSPMESDFPVYVKETSNGRVLVPAFVLEHPPVLFGETLQRYGILYYDAREKPCVIPDVWSDQDAAIARGWR
jgi:hypothetical protein